jgi:hypothetical protein
MDLGYRLWSHLTPLFNADNFQRNPNNALGRTVSFNMLCGALDVAAPGDLREITSPEEATAYLEDVRKRNAL